MSPAVRRLLLAAAILIGVLVLLVLALPYVVSLDAMRLRAEAAAGEALHRRVEIGKMRLQILSGPGAGVEKLVVHNTPGFETPALVSADRASVKVAFWPLLSRRIEVRKILLDGATVAVERAPDGKLNVDDFLSAGKRESAPASRTAAAALLVSRIELARARLLFADRKVVPGQTVTLAIEDLAGRITDIGPKTPARFELAARFLADSGRNLTLRGSLGPPPADGPVGEAPLDAAFSAKALQLKRLAPYAEALRSGDPGTLSLEGKARGRLLGALELAGKVAVDPAAPSSPLPATDGTFALHLDWTKGTLAIGRSLFDVASLPLAIEGRMDGLKTTPRADIRISTPGDVAIDDVTGLPGLAGRLPEGVRLAGRLRLDARIQGPFSDLETQGSAEAAPLDVRSGGQAYFEAPSARATVASRGSEPLSGRIVVPSGKVKGVPFEKLAADWTWDKGALTLAPSAGIFGGTLSARIESRPTRPESESRVALEVRGVEAAPLVASLTTAGDVFSGSLNGTMSLSTRGLGWDAVSKSGKGRGRLSVSGADLRTVRLMPEVARALSAVGQVAGFSVPASLESTKFSTLETSLELSGGRLETPDLRLSGRDVSVSADGSLGLDKTISYEGRITLGPGIVRSLGKAGRYMADAEGRIGLPFRASGAVTAPKVSIDDSIVVDLGKRVLARQAGERLGGEAGRVLGDVLGGEGKTNRPADLLQQFLKPRPTPRPTPR